MECAVSDRIRDVDAGAEDRDGVPAFFDGSPMGGRVNAARHSADNGRTGTHQGAGQGSSGALAVTRAIAGANDGDARFGKRRASADCVQLTRLLWQLQQLRRELRGVLPPTMNFQIRRTRSGLNWRHSSSRLAYNYVFGFDALL